MQCGYRTRIQAPPEAVWEPIRKIGGKTGWYFSDLLWRARGIADRLAGGVGLRRGRRHSREVLVGDALDFWRVLVVNPPHRLLLMAEMKVPGEALLEFQITPLGDDDTQLQMLSRFLPRGLAGIAYWYSLYPFHEWVFYGMLKAIARRIGKPVLAQPERFTPKLPRTACRQPADPD